MAVMKILIVDDEKQFADNLTEFLRLLGHKVHKAYTGEQATDILDKEKPDILLCDLKLSGVGTLDGDDVLTHLKSHSLKTIPIMLTAFKNEATQKRLASKGAVRCLYKPIQLKELESLLKELEQELNG